MPHLILDLPMRENDAGAETIREYVLLLARAVWHEGEGFSGKRPFGNSGWKNDVYAAMAAGGLIVGVPCDDTYDVPAVERKKADQLISAAIDEMLDSSLPLLQSNTGTADNGHRGQTA